MKVLITGAAGLYGLHTVEALVKRNDLEKVFAFDDFSRDVPLLEDFILHSGENKVEFVKQRFQDLTVKQLDDLDPDAVIHLAGYNSGKESMHTPEEYFLNNEYGTFQLIQTLLRTKNRPFFIYASTTEVYGRPVYEPINEEHRAKPLNTFAVTKLAAEKHAMAMGTWHDYPVTILRFTNTFGENENIGAYQSVISSFIERALRNEPLIIYGSGTQARDFIYIKDVVTAICAVIDSRRLVEQRIINIGTGKLTAISELAELVKQLTGSTSEFIQLPAGKDNHIGYKVDTDLAVNILSWTAKYSIEEGLMRTISWYRSLNGL